MRLNGICCSCWGNSPPSGWLSGGFSAEDSLIEVLGVDVAVDVDEVGVLGITGT